MCLIIACQEHIAMWKMYLVFWHAWGHIYHTKMMVPPPVVNNKIVKVTCVLRIFLQTTSTPVQISMTAEPDEEGPEGFWQLT